MKRSDRMRPLHDLASGRERDAGRELVALRGRIEEHERQLEQLRRYRDEYVAGGSPGLGSTDPVRLSNYGAFLGRLGDAIREQERRIGDLRRESERLVEVWREKRVESAALGQAVERLQEVEQRTLEREEQREQDDLSSQRVSKPRA